MGKASRITSDGRGEPWPADGLKTDFCSSRPPEAREGLLEAARNLRAYLAILREWADEDWRERIRLGGREIPPWLVDLDLHEQL